jgi:hypothetical protein
MVFQWMHMKNLFIFIEYQNIDHVDYLVILILFEMKILCLQSSLIYPFST